MTVCLPSRTPRDSFFSIYVFAANEPLFAQKPGDVGRQPLVSEKGLIIEISRHVKPVDADCSFTQLCLEIDTQRFRSPIYLGKLSVTVVN